MQPQRHCPECGTPLANASDESLCPKCLLGLAMQTQTRANSLSWTPPSIDVVANAFPQYSIESLIGYGGMGAVYHAKQPSLNRSVALKILPPELVHQAGFAQRFEREARAMASLNHPNIITIYDSGKNGDFYYFVMEYVDGINLREAIDQQSLTCQEAMAIVPQICDALQYAHEHSVVHRDIKPENILLNHQGQIKIADFGLARILSQDTHEFSLTATRQVLGTPKYMAPEQLEDTHAVDHRADIYSLGVVFYELLTGELPLGRFAAPSEIQNIDNRLDDIVLRTLEKHPSRRYQHAAEVKTDVHRIASPATDPASLQALPRTGYEYRSNRTLFGLPWVHVATGVDPRTGRRRVAKGFFAAGDIAVGVFSVGGVSVGLFSVGGICLSFIGIGGLILSLLFGLGGLSVSSGIATGGLAIGTGAAGGMAIGHTAMGGFAVGSHSMSGAGVSPRDQVWFRELWDSLPTWSDLMLCLALGVGSLILFVGACFGLSRTPFMPVDQPLEKDLTMNKPPKLDNTPPASHTNHSNSVVTCLVVGIVGFVITIVVLIGLAVAFFFMTTRTVRIEKGPLNSGSMEVRIEQHKSTALEQDLD